MFRPSLIFICLTSAWAQRPATYDFWLKTSQDKNLIEIHALLVQPNAPAWPEVATVPNPLAAQIHKRMKELEGLGPHRKWRHTRARANVRRTRPTLSCRPWICELRFGGQPPHFIYPPSRKTGDRRSKPGARVFHSLALAGSPFAGSAGFRGNLPGGARQDLPFRWRHPRSNDRRDGEAWRHERRLPESPRPQPQHRLTACAGESGCIPLSTLQHGPARTGSARSADRVPSEKRAA